jgi:pimeloyl-ACP methyl ester carboxylesterase
LETPDFSEFRFAASDKLDLYGRLYGTLAPDVLPLVCLPGLTRNSRDFHAFALALRAGPSPRAVVTLDYRGRGRSAWPADAASYAVPVEAADVLAGLGHLGIERAIFVGTSRGALIVHVMALMAPGAIAGAVLNDAGPRLEAEGLRAIRAAVGRAGPFADWAAAIDHVAALNAPTFPALGRADFERIARAHFTESAAGIVIDYDPRLAEALALLDLDQPLPELWDAFSALSPVPLMVIRGSHSLLLSAETVAAMAAAHPSLKVIEVAGQGHAPLLETADLPAAIARFADDAQARPAPARAPDTPGSATGLPDAGDSP